MISAIVRVSSFLIVIPFLALFYVKTDKLDFLKNYGVLAFFVPIFVYLMFGTAGFPIDLVFAYMIFVVFGASIFNSKGWSYPQALSLSFCLVFFASFYWELPTHIYTIIVNGGIDGAFPLHLLYIFPMVFVYEKVKTNRSRKDIALLIAVSLIVSTFVLGLLLAKGLNIWYVKENLWRYQTFMETGWMFNRVVAVFSLFAIYWSSSLRKEAKM